MRSKMMSIISKGIAKLYVSYNGLSVFLPWCTITFLPMLGNPEEMLEKVVPPFVDFNTCPKLPCVVK